MYSSKAGIEKDRAPRHGFFLTLFTISICNIHMRVRCSKSMRLDHQQCFSDQCAVLGTLDMHVYYNSIRLSILSWSGTSLSNEVRSHQVLLWSVHRGQHLAGHLFDVGVRVVADTQADERLCRQLKGWCEGG
jgi:hypothetical protein